MAENVPFGYNYGELIKTGLKYAHFHSNEVF